MGQSENTARANQRSSWHAMQLIPSSADAAILPTATGWFDSRDAKASLHPRALALSMASLQLVND